MFNNDFEENKRIRVLLVSPLPSLNSFGGIGMWTSRFLDVVKQNKNVDIKVINSIPIDNYGRDIARSKNIFKKLKCNFRILKNIKRELKSFEPHVVHLNTSCTPFACVRDYFFLKTVLKKKIQSIIHCRCNVSDQIKNNKFGLFFFKKNIKLVSCVLVLNNNSFKFVNSLANIKAKCFIIPNFLKKDYIIQNKMINKHIKNISFVGHLVKEKGIEEICFLASEFSNLHFILGCGFTEEYPSTTVFPSNVKITGNLNAESVVQLLDKSDLFLFPTYSEGFSNALLEAMARGLPIVTTNVGANFDMLENKGGIVVDSKSKEQLKLALYKIDDEYVRRKMSKWNLNKVKNFYTEEIILNEILDIYYNLASMKGSC